MKWLPRARLLAHQVARLESRWHTAVSETPRHVFVPRWWENQGDGTWALRTGDVDEVAWLAAAYSDRSLTIQVGTHPADRANDGDVLVGGRSDLVLDAAEPAGAYVPARDDR